MGDLSLPTPVSIRILHVEDDQFQQMSMAAVVKMIEAKNSGAQLELVGATTGAEALQILESSDQFDLVLLDYKLPGGDGDTVLPTIRSMVGHLCAIVMLSGNAQEASMQRCWLDLGADSYRLKPVAAPVVSELLNYSLQKRSFLQKRRRIGPSSLEGSMAVSSISGGAFKRDTQTPAAAASAAGPATVGRVATSSSTSSSMTREGDSMQAQPMGALRTASDTTSSAPTAAVMQARSEQQQGAPRSASAEGLDRKSRSSKESDKSLPENLDHAEEAPGILSLLAYGRRGPVSLGFAHGKPCAIKVFDRRFVRGPSPPAHPYVNRARRLIKGEQCVEVRQLCDGGELFDHLTELYDDLAPLSVSFKWFAQLVAAVAHCHLHGAVHGQMQPHHLLMRAEGEELQLVGFSVCCPPAIPPSNSNEKMAMRTVSDSSSGGSGTIAMPDVSDSSAAAGGGGGGGGGGGTASGGAAAAAASSAEIIEDQLVELRQWHPLEAPELKGRQWARSSELRAADVWSLGVLLVYLLTGRPSTTVTAAQQQQQGGGGGGPGGASMDSHSTDFELDISREMSNRTSASSSIDSSPRMTSSSQVAAGVSRLQISGGSSSSTTAMGGGGGICLPGAASAAVAAAAAVITTPPQGPSTAPFNPQAMQSPMMNPPMAQNVSAEAAGGGAPQPPTSEFTALMMMASDMLQPMPDRRPSAYEVENGLKALAKRSGDALGQRDADSEYDGDDDSNSCVSHNRDSHGASPLR